jgi:DNA-binding response OmpR family regulator
MNDSAEAPRILVVEDEWVIAELVKALLEKAGFHVCGPMSNSTDALAFLADNHSDAALLDIHLGRADTSFPVAQQLAERGVPFAFVTAYSRSDLPEHLADRPIVRKPFSSHALEAQVRALLAA